MSSNQSPMAKSELGLTLIEVLTVLVIIGIVAGIAVVSLGDSNKSAIRKSCTTNYYTVQAAIRIFQNDHAGELPTNTAGEKSLDGLVPEYIATGLLDFDSYAFKMQPEAVSPGYSIQIFDKKGNHIPADLTVSAPEACSSI